MNRIDAFFNSGTEVVSDALRVQGEVNPLTCGQQAFVQQAFVAQQGFSRAESSSLHRGMTAPLSSKPSFAELLESRESTLA